MSVQMKAPRTRGHLTKLEKLSRNEVPLPPIASLIGFQLAEVALGRAVTEMGTSRRHANPMGSLHGGVICDLADAAMGMAFATTLEENESFTTIDLTAKYFKPIWETRLRATATVTKRTRALGLIECEVIDEKESLVAKVFSTCMVLRGDDAKGR